MGVHHHQRPGRSRPCRWPSPSTRASTRPRWGLVFAASLIGMVPVIARLPARPAPRHLRPAVRRRQALKGPDIACCSPPRPRYRAGRAGRASRSTRRRAADRSAVEPPRPHAVARSSCPRASAAATPAGPARGRVRRDRSSTGDGSTAVEVLARTRRRGCGTGSSRPSPPTGTSDRWLRLFRRLHLTAAQFYDWAYRHADLVGPDREWSDPLGQPVSMDTVRALTAGLADGRYAADRLRGRLRRRASDEWPQLGARRPARDRRHAVRPGRLPVHCGSSRSAAGWRISPSDLRAGGRGGRVRRLPPRPVRLPPPGGTRPDGDAWSIWPTAFDALIRRGPRGAARGLPHLQQRQRLPGLGRPAAARRTPPTPKCGSRTTPLADLAAVATRARPLAPDRPAVLAAYQTVYDTFRRRWPTPTTRLTMATAVQPRRDPAAGRRGRDTCWSTRTTSATTRPSASTVDMLARWYDLLVAAGDMSCSTRAPSTSPGRWPAPSTTRPTSSRPAPVNHRGEPGTIWRRVVETPHGTVVHLINLADQIETGWDTPKRPMTSGRRPAVETPPDRP